MNASVTSTGWESSRSPNTEQIYICSIRHLDQYRYHHVFCCDHFLQIFFGGYGGGGGGETLSKKKKRSILSYFFVVKSVSNKKSNDTYRHFIICDRGSISVKLLPMTVQSSTHVWWRVCRINRRRTEVCFSPDVIRRGWRAQSTN